MPMAFPAGGSLYYTKDLVNVRESGHPARGRAFLHLVQIQDCVCGQRSQLDVDLGLYESAEAALVKAVDKELAHLEQFGCPLLPFERVRREGYKYQEQSPSDHIENLHRYRLIAPSIIPRNLGSFCIRHPDLQPSNIIVSRASDSNLHVVGLLDWQHTSILPEFLLAGIPQRFQNYNNLVSQSMARPLPPENLDDMDENKQSFEKDLYRRRLVHYHYIKITEQCNALQYPVLLEPMSVLRRCLFEGASSPRKGETLALKVLLLEATENWEALTGGIVSCPIMFDTEDVRKTMELDEVQKTADETLKEFWQAMGFAEDGWVPTERYEKTMALKTSR